MKRRDFLTLVSLAPALVASVATTAASASAGGMLSLHDISGFFNSFETAEGDFTQVNPDGSLSTGRLMIHRPGRVRFEYDPPNRDLVIASAGSVNIFDARSNQGPTVYPLRRTPLNLILGRRVDLTRERMVVDHFRDGPTTVVVAQDPERPEYGNIRLVFSADPIELRQWVITDDMGRETTVILGDLRLDTRLTANIFDVDRELRQRGITQAP